MKVIDLLNKIAKGEEVSKRIRYKGIVFTYIWTNRKALKYVNEEYEDGDNARRHLFWYVDSFDDEVEVIEEKKEIEKINYYPIRKNEIAVDYIENNETKHFCLNKKEKYFVDKINELVRELNELKNK